MAPDSMSLLRDKREEILGDWLSRTLESYPEQTQAFLRRERDRFRNPAGRILREGLAVLLDEILGEMDPERTNPALLEIVRLRNVQDFTPGRAVGFVFLLKETLRGDPELRADPAAVEAVFERVDRLILQAFDLYVQCREKMAQIRVDEARRRVFMLERSNPHYFAPEEEDDEE